MYECIRVYTNAFIHDIVHIIHIDVTIYIYESIINTYIYNTYITHLYTRCFCTYRKSWNPNPETCTWAGLNRRCDDDDEYCEMNDEWWLMKDEWWMLVMMLVGMMMLIDGSWLMIDDSWCWCWITQVSSSCGSWVCGSKGRCSSTRFGRTLKGFRRDLYSLIRLIKFRWVDPKITRLRALHLEPTGLQP